MENNAYVYQHRRIDTNEVFYVGIGTELNLKRAYDKKKRSTWWKNVVKKAGYTVDIIYKNISWKQACKYEINLISMYGRKDLGTGLLVNMTAGGEGAYGRIVTEKQKEKLREKSLNYNKLNPRPKLYKQIRRKYNNPFDMPSTRIILNTQTGVYYSGIIEASKSCNIPAKTLYDWINGRYSNKSDFINC